MRTMELGALTVSLALAAQLSNASEARAERLSEPARSAESSPRAHAAGRMQRSIDMSLGGSEQSCDVDCSVQPPRSFSFVALPAELLRELGEVPVLGAVIMPVTEGVTFTPFDGLPPVTFAVKPTKITRGSGLVAIGTF